MIITYQEGTSLQFLKGYKIPFRRDILCIICPYRVSSLGMLLVQKLIPKEPACIEEPSLEITQLGCRWIRTLAKNSKKRADIHCAPAVLLNDNGNLRKLCFCMLGSLIMIIYASYCCYMPFDYLYTESNDRYMASNYQKRASFWYWMCEGEVNPVVSNL